MITEFEALDLDVLGDFNIAAASNKFDIEAVKDYYNDMFELCHKLNFQTLQIQSLIF